LDVLVLFGKDKAKIVESAKNDKFLLPRITSVCANKIKEPVVSAAGFELVISRRH